MSGPRYLDRDRGRQDGPDYLDRKTGVDWQNHEDDVAKRSGGKKRRASGAAPGKPADTRDQEFLRECKSTKRGAKGMSIKGEWLPKLVGEALPLGKTPLFEFRFEGQQEPVPRDWVMLPAMEFEELLERLREDPE